MSYKFVPFLYADAPIEDLPGYKRQQVTKVSKDIYGQNKSALSLYPHWGISNINKLKKYQTQQNNWDQANALLHNPQAAPFIAASKLNSEVTWDNEDKIWKMPKNLVNKFLPAVGSSYAKNLQQATHIIGQHISQSQIVQQVPPLVANLVASNQALSKYGIGPISSDSLPLYAGRWLDPMSGRIRLLPAASQKFINPLSKSQKLGYLQAQILNRWNKFVQAQQQYMKLLPVDSTQYRNNKIAVLRKNLQKKPEPIKILKSWSNLLVTTNWNFNNPVYSKIFGIKCPRVQGLVDSGTLGDQLTQFLPTSWDIPYAKAQQLYKDCLVIFGNAYNVVTSRKYDTIQQLDQIKRESAKIYNIAVMGRPNHADAVKNVIRTAIPEDLDQGGIMQLQQKYFAIQDGIKSLPDPRQIGGFKNILANLASDQPQRSTDLINTYIQAVKKIKPQVTVAGVRFPGMQSNLSRNMMKARGDGLVGMGTLDFQAVKQQQTKNQNKLTPQQKAALQKKVSKTVYRGATVRRDPQYQQYLTKKLKESNATMIPTTA